MPTDDALQREHARLSALSRVSLSLTSTLDVNAVLQRVVETAQMLADSAHAHIFLFDAERDELTHAVSHWDTTTPVVPLQPRRGGITHAVAHSGAPEFIEDAARHPAYAALAPADRPGALACLPLVKNQRVLGTLNLGYWGATIFDAETREFLALMAAQAALAIDNARLYEAATRQAAELRQRVAELAAVNAISERVLSLDRHAIQRAALEHIHETFHAAQCAIILHDAGAATMTVRAMLPADDPGAGLTFALENNSILSAALQSHKPVVWRDDPKDSAADNLLLAYLRARGIQSLVLAPLAVEEKRVGFVAVNVAARALSAAEMTLLDTMTNQVALAINNAGLFEQLLNAYDTTIAGWSRALDLRDKETEGHTQRVTELAVRLARALGSAENEIVHLRRGALLHDIGKMGIPDSILHKPGALTDDETRVMRQHPQFAYEMLAPIEYLYAALAIPFAHHEKWDGSGYPRGLRGDAIPLAARIFAVVDVWDALTVDRPYRKAMPRADARAYIESQSGAHFDPRIVAAFIEMIGAE